MEQSHESTPSSFSALAASTAIEPLSMASSGILASAGHVCSTACVEHCRGCLALGTGEI